MTPASPSDAAPTIAWTTSKGVAASASWHSEAGVSAPRRVELADDTLSADSAYRLACAGTGMLWRGDFQNARQLLQALARRADNKPAKAAARAVAKAAAASPQERFNLHRQAQSQRARTLGTLLIALEPDYSIALRRAPDWRAAITEAWGPATGEPTVVSLRELLGVVGAHEWRKTGVEISVLGEAPGNRIHPHYGVFSPIRGEYLDLVAQQPLPGDTSLAMDIGTGTGVLAALLVRRGIKRVVATENAPRALTCAKDNLQRLGLTKQVELHSTDLFPPAARRSSSATRPGCRHGPRRRWSTPSTTKAARCCAAFWRAWRTTSLRAAKPGCCCRTWRSTWACARARSCWAGSPPPACRCWAAAMCARTTPRRRTRATPCMRRARPR